MFHHYRRLIALRHAEPVVAHGDFTMLLPDHEQVYAFTRRYARRGAAGARRTSPASPADVELPPGWAGAELVLGNVAEPAAGGALAPWEARIHRRGRLE